MAFRHSSCSQLVAAPNLIAHVLQVLADFWGELLRLPDVSATDDFFLAGGHSLLAIQLTAKILKTFQVRHHVWAGHSVIPQRFGKAETGTWTPSAEASWLWRTCCSPASMIAYF